MKGMLIAIALWVAADFLIVAAWIAAVTLYERFEK